MDGGWRRGRLNATADGAAERGLRLWGHDGNRMCCVIFFFSSRRRHTRFDCDWSSDVCSSDLFERVSPEHWMLEDKLLAVRARDAQLRWLLSCQNFLGGDVLRMPRLTRRALEGQQQQGGGTTPPDGTTVARHGAS